MSDCALLDAQMQVLLAAGANVNASDNDGSTPAHAAAFNNQLQALLVLAELARADVTLTDNEGLTPAQVRYVYAAASDSPDAATAAVASIAAAAADSPHAGAGVVATATAAAAICQILICDIAT